MPGPPYLFAFPRSFNPPRFNWRGGHGATVRQTRPRRGKAPPVDAFTEENHEVYFDDWLPVLRNEWNNWDQDELLIQLVGHLRGQALQEWNLMDATE